MELSYTYLRSQCRLKVISQKLQDSLYTSSVVFSPVVIGCSRGGETGGRLSSRLYPGVAGVFESACSSITDELSLSVGAKAEVSSSEIGSAVRYGACITGLISSSKTNGLKEEESEKSRESPNLDSEEAQLVEEEIKRGKGEDYKGLRPRLFGVE